MQPIHVVLVILWATPAAVPGQTLTRVSIESPEAPTLAERMMRDGFDVLEGSVTPTSLELVVTEAELAALVRDGYEPQIIEIGRPFREIQAERLAGRAPPTGYPDLSEILTEINAAAVAYPAICQVVDLTTRYGTPSTFEGRHLFAVKISDNVTQDEDEPAFLLVSDHHAREIVTPVIALYMLERLTTLYGIDTTVTDLVDEYEIWIAPVWNPDGYEYVFNVDNLWRKNRRVFPEGVGVDLNRNYPFGWDSPCGGSTDVVSAVYRGPAPASETETQSMIALAEDRRFPKVADLHSAGREVRFGLACLNHPFISFLLAEAGDLAAESGYAPATSCCTGGDFGYHLATKASHAFLWETATTFQPAFASAQAEAVVVLPGVLSLLQRPVPLSGYVSDAASGEPLTAAITYPGVNFENGETNASHPRFGRYHAFLPAGSYSVVFSADGYIPQTFDIDVTSDTAQYLDVELDAGPIPAASGWGLAALALALLTAGSVLLRARVSVVR